ncbi:hypothetical protein D3OALGA1CA_4823 [Olavius algarvensis associated proteobacterium Delta 3]|nr:hypothetical protein D3OALGA1CA_4823 [Olavius algarvensis associated proteobacterium Delta 3]
MPPFPPYPEVVWFVTDTEVLSIVRSRCSHPITYGCRPVNITPSAANGSCHRRRWKPVPVTRVCRDHSQLRFEATRKSCSGGLNGLEF